MRSSSAWWNSLAGHLIAVIGVGMVVSAPFMSDNATRSHMTTGAGILTLLASLFLLLRAQYTIWLEDTTFYRAEIGAMESTAREEATRLNAAIEDLKARAREEATRLNAVIEDLKARPLLQGEIYSVRRMPTVVGGIEQNGRWHAVVDLFLWGTVRNTKPVPTNASGLDLEGEYAGCPITFEKVHFAEEPKMFHYGISVAISCRAEARFESKERIDLNKLSASGLRFALVDGFGDRHALAVTAGEIPVMGPRR